MISEVDEAKKCYQIGLKVAKIIPLDKKNVTVRINHKLSRDKKGPKNGQKVPK